MKLKFFSLLAVTTLFMAAACGDSETEDGTGGSSAGGTGGTAPSCAGPNGESKADAGDCQTACEILFCCAAEECAGLSASDEDAFVPGCVDTCMGMMATIAVVDASDCAMTVGTVSSVSTDFASTCTDGIPMGGAGGTSAGGAGGAGGN